MKRDIKKEEKDERMKHLLWLAPQKLRLISLAYQFYLGLSCIQKFESHYTKRNFIPGKFVLIC